MNYDEAVALVQQLTYEENLLLNELISALVQNPAPAESPEVTAE